MRNIFEGSFAKESKGAGKDIFEEGLKCVSSEARKNFDSTDSAVQI